MAAAKAALNTLVDELPDDAKVGLRIYGSEVSGTGEAEGCADTKLVSLVAPLALSASTYMLDADEAPGQSGPYPVELSVRVSGKVIGEPASSKDSEDAPSSDVGSSADEGTSDLVLAAGGAGGILVGVLAGGAAAGLGRRRPA